MATTRRTIHFDDEARRAIDWGGGGSGYLCAVLAQRQHLIGQCLGHLVGVGWTHDAIAAVCEESAAFWCPALSGAGCEAMAAIAAPLGYSIAPAEGYALAVLASEWWAGHEGLKRYLREQGAPEAQA